jgi:acetyl-CoA acyltransferase
MPQAVIVDAVRTAGGKRNGKLRNWHAVDLASEALRALAGAQRPRPGPGRRRDHGLRHAGLRAVAQHRPQRRAGRRLARVGARHHHRPPVRLLPAGLHFAAQGVMAGAYDVVVAAGVESMTRTPMGSSVVRELGYPFGPRMMARYADRRADWSARASAPR